jgi:hypothetical protein
MNAPPTADELRRECHSLIESLYRHRLNIRLLRSARLGLQMLCGYKANRKVDFSQRNVSNVQQNQAECIEFDHWSD